MNVNLGPQKVSELNDDETEQIAGVCNMFELYTLKGLWPSILMHIYYNLK